MIRHSQQGRRRLALLLLLAIMLLCRVGDASDLILDAQKKLKEFGYNPGPLDGVWGAKTEVALKKFQQARALHSTGELDENTKFALGLTKAPKVLQEQLLHGPPALTLRSKPASLGKQDILNMIRQKGFHHPDDYSGIGLSGSVKGTIRHQYESRSFYGEAIVIDRSTGLIWQKTPTPFVSGKAIDRHVKLVNANRYAGLSGWRLPSIEELASLLESPEKKTDFLDPVFDMPYWFCASVDRAEGEDARWIVFFEAGYVHFHDAADDFDILLVKGIDD
ncbi:MAG: DUF1566 domain-containing protein [bacterium]|nr:DUF1566 domain-containing protein [bacterium]